jgi:ribulose-phosphate 3-epimerase
MIDVVAGILEKDVEVIARKIALVSRYVSTIQIKIADNTLVPNETVTELEGLKEILANYPDTIFEAHLMVANPEKYIRAVADAGFTRVIAHIESNDPRQFLAKVRYEELEVGLALDGGSELREIEPFLEEIDFVMILMVEAGFAGQPFLPESIEKIKLIHQNVPDLVIEADGAINTETVKAIKDVGATRIVSTSFLFKNPDAIEDVVESLKNA